MNKLKIAAAGIVLAFTAAASPALAGNILWFEDQTLGTSAVGGAIALTGNTSTFTSDSGTFNTLLAGGGWDLVIYGEQGFSSFDESADALTSYVAGGGKLIGATWVDGGLEALLQGVATGSTNSSPITTSAHPIFAGLGGSIGLTNPGWAAFNIVRTPVDGATGLGAIDDGFGVILGNGGRTLLNGPLFDSFSSLSQGEQFIANQINFLTASITQTSVDAVPLPSAAWMGLGTLAALGLASCLRRRKPASID